MVFDASFNNSLLVEEIGEKTPTIRSRLTVKEGRNIFKREKIHCYLRNGFSVMMFHIMYLKILQHTGVELLVLSRLNCNEMN